MADGAEPVAKPVRTRAFVAGFLVLVPVAYASSNALTSHIFSLLVSPIAALFLLVVANLALRRLSPRLELSQGDLTVAFSLLWVGSAASAEWAAISHPPIHSLAFQAGQDATIRDRMLPNLPEWLVLHDASPVKDMAVGGLGVDAVVSKLGILGPKYLAWGLIFALATGAMLCLNSLMRGAWCKTERLAYPMIQLPVAMAEQGGRGTMWRSKAMWFAFAIMFGIDMLNGLNYLYPNLPSIPVKEFVNLQTLFPDPPLSNVGYLPISLYPFLAAIGLLIPSDLLFSLVAFFLLRKAAHVVLAANGIPQHTFSGTGISPGPPYFDEQTWGAVIAMFAGSHWYARSYVRQVVADIRTGAASLDGGVRHRWTFVGFLFCAGGLVAVGVSGGLPLPWMVLYVGLILIFAAVLARLRAQLGPPTHEFAYFAANSFMSRFFGNVWMTDKQAALLSTAFFPFNRIARTHPAPYQLESIKMTKDEGTAQRPVFWGIFGFGVVAFLLAFFFLHMYAYRTGTTNAWPEHASTFRALTENPHGPDVWGIGMTVFGFLFVAALDAVRFRFPGFPIHPGGYVLGMNFGVDYYWFGLVIALLVKSSVTRYGGMKGYAVLRHIAFGIILGEVLAEAIWMAIALATHQSTYTISVSPRGFGIQ